MRREAFLVLALAMMSLTAHARRPSPQEEQRRKLLEKLGLEKKDQPPKPSEPVPEPEPPAPPATQAPPPERESAPATPFVGRVHQSLMSACAGCHAPSGPAAHTRLVLTGDPARDHGSARKMVDLARPRRSLLLTKGVGVEHGGGAAIAESSEAFRRLLRWVAGGAVLSAAGEAAASGAPPPAPTARAPRRRQRTEPGAGPFVPPPAAPPVAAPPSVAAELEAPSPPSAPAVADAVVSAPAELPPVARTLHAELMTWCRSCHAAGAPAGHTRYRLTGDRTTDLRASRPFVDTSRPAASPLATKAAGEQHGGGTLWPPDSAPHRTLLAWIAAGAPAEPVPAPAAPAIPPPDPARPPATGPAEPAPPPPPAPSHPPILAFSVLGSDIALNGRFDLNLERRGVAGLEGGQTALRSYHHFVFLSRQGQDDPFTFTAEIVGLTFYEAAVKLAPRGARWNAHLRAGKILVPFGAEPLFHQSYGGLAGFDQRVLPVIWAAEGAAASGGTRWGDLLISGDLFGVQGHRLRRADAVLNLQNDLAPLEDVRVAFGARLGLAWGPLATFYSTYASSLGHDRFLFMQALDASLWRWRDVPVMDRLVLGLGLLRADVSGGGSGVDHYHFASYWLARAYLFDWLFVQYRQGLHTFDNRRGLFSDARRFDQRDGSTHNLGVIARYRNLLAGAYYYMNLEKADEVDDDFLRFTVAFDF